MRELRQDPVTDNWVVISTARLHRPLSPSGPRPRNNAGPCPFCPGHESMTPPEVFAFRDGSAADSPGWRVRCVPNPFPILQDDGGARTRVDRGFHSLRGVGAHEVLVETADHAAHPATLGTEQLGLVAAAYAQRFAALAQDERLRYVLVFKNHGEPAGASVAHAHSQIVSMPIVPARVDEEIAGILRYRDGGDPACPYCQMAATESELASRVVYENDAFVVLCPYASRFPFETLLLPRAHASDFHRMTDGVRRDFVLALEDLLGRIHGVLQDPAFNYYVHTAPTAGDPRYHWHLELTPRLSEIGGFEQGTGVYVNGVVPEDAAAILRGEAGPDAAGPNGLVRPR